MPWWSTASRMGTVSMNAAKESPEPIQQRNLLDLYTHGKSVTVLGLMAMDGQILKGSTEDIHVDM